MQGRKKFKGPDYEILKIVINHPEDGIISDSPSKYSFFKLFTSGATKYSTVYENDATKSYFHNITKLDWGNRIISGEFECALKEAPGGTNLQI